MFVGQRVKTITHFVELLGFVQNRIRRHRTPAFQRTELREDFRWADLVQEA